MRSLAAVLIALAAVWPLPVRAQHPALTVAYLERPPYYWTDEGTPKGFLLELTRRILAKAGVDATFVPCPPSRVIEELRRNDSPLCSIGWFRNPERETFATFSLPVYRDRPIVVLTTRQNASRVGQYTRLENLFRDEGLVMAQVASFSYGRTVDRLQTTTRVRTLTVSTTQSVLPQLIAEGRAGYMLIAPEEVPVMLASAGVDPADFVEFPMEDIPAGNLRYLIFSKNLPAETLQRIDDAIESFVNQKALQTQPLP